MIILRKIQELETAEFPNNKPTGYEKRGKLLAEPEVGKCVILLGKFTGGLKTSEVQEIIDKDTFKTVNSIYKIIREDETS